MTHARALLLAFGLLALAGCSSIRLAYDNAPRLTWWWLDGYVDFTNEQTPQVKRAIDDFYAWHRQSQLLSYAALLAELQGTMLQPTSSAAVCRWQDRLQTALQPTFERALKITAERLPVLSEVELSNIRKRYDKSNDDFRKDYLQPDPVRRAEAAFDRVEERAAKVYGSLNDDQKALVRDHLARSAMDPASMLAERQRRQRDTIDTLRRLQAENVATDRRLDAWRGLGERAESSPDPGYRGKQARLREDNCEFIAQLHNASTPEQRAKARDILKGYETDLRALAAAAE